MWGNHAELSNLIPSVRMEVNEKWKRRENKVKTKGKYKRKHYKNIKKGNRENKGSYRKTNKQKNERDR